MTISAVKDSTLCSQLLALGVDLFGIDNIDEDKLHNIATCEHKRLHGFANEFPHEQHLLNLQSILVSLLVHLARKLSNIASINEFVRELSRISVLIHELDCELAKAKRRKKYEFSYGNTTTKETESAIRLAAEKVKDYDNRKARYYQGQTSMLLEQEKLKDQAEKLQAQAEAEALAAQARLISSHALQATLKFLPHYRLKCSSLRLDEKVKMIKMELKLIIAKMQIAPETQKAVLIKALTQLKLKPQ